MKPLPPLPLTFWVRVFLPFGCGYFLSYVYRSVNATVADDLVQDLSLDPWSIGLLTSAYFLAFAVAQLPIGLALDEFGPRKTEAILLCFAAIGGGLFAIAETPRVLILARALIGLGVASCLMAAFKSFVDFAPPTWIPALNGWVMAFGSSGAIVSTTPVAWSLQYTDWRGVFGILSVLSIATMAMVWFVVPEPESRSSSSLASSFSGVQSVFRNRAFLSITPLAVAHQSTYLAIQGLWAGPWLRDVADMEQDRVAGHLFWLAVAMVVGYLAFGWLSQRVVAREGSLLALLVWANLGYSIVVLSLAAGGTKLALALWFGFGLFGSAGMLSYVILSRRFPPTLSGRVTTALTLLTFLSAFTVQSGMGAVIGWWTPEGASRFSPDGYRASLLLVAVSQFAALIWLKYTQKWRQSLKKLIQHDS